MSKLKRIRYAASGFTLIELLIVIVIIGILAGVVLAVINPAQQQLKSRQAVLKANTDKGCLAINACEATSSTVADCDTVAEVGIIDPSGTPTSSTYALTAPGAGAVTYTGTLGTCNYSCTANITNGTPAGLAVAAAACLIK
jgi:prepilin-type N-terminal cleavage/methylation domain-containing protein